MDYGFSYVPRFYFVDFNNLGMAVKGHVVQVWLVLGLVFYTFRITLSIK